jgi:WD40 repeat protein
MGIYDVCWLDNSTIATCSADNTIKLWAVSAEGNLESKDTFIQHDGAKDTAYYLLGFASTKDGNLTAVNLNGSLVNFNQVTSAADKHPHHVSTRHTYLIDGLISFDKFVVYTSQKRIYYFDVANPDDIHTVGGLPNE